MFSRNRNEKPSDETVAGVDDDADSAPPLQVKRRPEPRNSAAVNKPSIISAGFELVGDLVSTGVVQVEGTVRGNLRLSAVTIGTTGEVVGTIDCRTLHIKGKFLGQARCEELTLSADALVDGALTYMQMSAQRGARIKGELLKGQPVPVAAQALPTGVEMTLPETEAQSILPEPSEPKA
jgi:cytoskeletal protein CcmA (bactofilin family)